MSLLPVVFFIRATKSSVKRGFQPNATNASHASQTKCLRLAYNLTQAVCVRCVKILRNETYANTLRGLRGVDCVKRCIVLHTRKFI